MKKLFASLLFASSLCLTACGASESSGSAKSKLNSSGYSTTVYTAEQAKERYKGLTFEGFELVDAIYGTKGEGDKKGTPHPTLVKVGSFSSVGYHIAVLLSRMTETGFH